MSACAFPIPSKARREPDPANWNLASYVVQITSDDFGGLYALRSDGSIWHRPAGKTWNPVPDIEEDN